MTLQEIEWIARIVLAGICGLLIGFERQKRSKVAGVRTHCVVAVVVPPEQGDAQNTTCK